MVHRRHRIWQGGILGALVLGGFFATGAISAILAQTSGSCSLAVNSAYRASNSRGVYYIADDCTKRPIRDPNVYFSHFSSWNDVHVVSPATLAAIPDSALSFLPWGPRRTFQNGSLLKTVDDPRVYVISDNTRRAISSEQVFTGLGLQWNWVEDVVPSVMQRFSTGDQVASATTYPDGLTVKYPDSPRVYVLETNNGQTERQYAPTMESLQSYRADHIITLPANRVFPDTSAPLPTPVAPTTPVTPANPTTPVRAPAAPLSLVLSNVTDSSVTLTWRDRSSDESGFVVQRRLGRTGSFSDVATVDANIITFVDSGLTANQYYGYRVRAVNSRGDSAYTNEAGTTTHTATVVTPVPPTTPVTPPTTPATPGASTNDLVPLTDLGTGMYLGRYMGGLYSNGSNYAPASHDTEAKARAAAIQPINGKVVMISIGMSNTNQEFCSFPSPTAGAAAACNSWSFSGQAAANTNVNHSNLTIVNCARGGQSANLWVDPRALNTDNGVHNNYDICDGRLAAASVAPNQVQVAWVKVANPLAPSNGTSLPGATTPRIALPNENADAYLLEQELGQIVRSLKVRYPNIKQVYFSSRIYGGYSTTDAGISPEPYAYQGGFAAKWIIQAQIDQMAQGRIVDSRAGDLNYSNTPVLLWGPYLWANGTNARQTALPWDPAGMTWSRSDEEADATHPSDEGERKVGLQLLTYFLGSPYSAPWFSVGGRQVNPAGQAVSGASTPTPVTNVSPTVTITSPSNNTSVTAGTSVALIATAADTDGTVTNVEFLNGSTVLGSDATSPYSFTWTNVQSGAYTLTARATDNRGAQTVSSPISLTVNSATVPVTPPPVSGSGQVNTANANSGLGTNVSQFNYWSAEISFKDAFRRARNWVCSGSCTYDTNGWPVTGRSETVLFAGLANKYPNGQYISLYDAASGGTITYSGSAVKNTALSRPGRDVVDVNSANGNLSIIVNGNVRNIRLIFPGGDCGDIFTYAASASDCPAGAYRSNEQTYESQPFHSLYLSKMKNYKSIRYLWWMLADPYVKTPRLTTPIAWANRPKPTDAIWFNKGVPVEYMVQLANTLNADPWFGIPHLANDLLSDNPSDPYVRQFATYVRDHLNPNLKSYVEYSNEVWNGGQWGYEQANYAEEQGLALNLAPGDRNRSRFRYQAQQSVKLFHIWNDVFGGRGTERVVRVLAAQGGNPWTGIQLMDWQDAYKEADALAGAPYIDIAAADQNTVANYTVDQLFNYINTVRLPAIYTAMRQNIENATSRINSLGRPLEYVAYEGGQHLVELGANQTNANMNRILDAANRDARMGTVYTNLLTTWKQSGGHMFEHFVNTMQYSAGGVGRFGLLESLLQDSSPKYDAVMAFIRANPKWW